jgi:cation-transporting ATPase 13A3/4/5
MVTGDNAHCGYYIGRACGIVGPSTPIDLSDPDTIAGTVLWADMDPDADGEATRISTDAVLARCTPGGGGAELAITGKAMSILTASGKLDQLLLLTRIFARVQPDQKVQVVDAYISRGLITGMCGDGGNDCGALRTAHAGIALSDAEASVVSPFTSSTKSVRSVVDVLCEGRCALVTSFAAYRFYITYGLNWSIVKTINFVYGVRMPITAYLTIDSICSWLCAWAITGALPLDKLLPYVRPCPTNHSPRCMSRCFLPVLTGLKVGTALP